MKLLRSLSLLLALLATSLPAHSAGFGWYYESFSWPALQSYFGGGTERQQKDYLQHMEALAARERATPYYYIQLPKARQDLWASFITQGLRYSALDRSQAQFADQVISIIMWPGAPLKALNVRSETNPDYIHPGAWVNLAESASPAGKKFLALFEFGRRYGEPGGLAACAGDGGPWFCYEAYVILSPAECAAFAKELQAILASKSFEESEYEERQFVAPFVKALARAARKNRGVYLHVTD